jgi:hypothetical protein
MSVTVHIANDTDKSVVERYDCQRCSYDGKVSPDCPECQGKGEVVFTSSQWALNMANCNFATIFSALGLYTDCCGEVDPRVLLKAIDAYVPGLAVRETVVAGNMISCGLDEAAVSYRFSGLRKIAEEAARREEKVFWG